MEVAEAFSLISRAIDSGHAAHGYLLCGDLRGQCDVLADLVLKKLFPDAADQLAAKSHPDVYYLEPSGKSRTIKVEKTDKDPSPGMRDAIVEPMSTTAFSGGWKVGVIVSADRLQPAAANAFLKSLEEPGPQTLYLLLTDQPDAILSTIISRCQRIDLPLSEGILAGEDYEEVAAAFAEKDAARLAAKFAELKDEADDADVALVRKAFFKTLMSFVRTMMIKGSVPRFQAFRNVEAVEDAYRQSERSMSDDAVLSFLLDRITFPTGPSAGARE